LQQGIVGAALAGACLLAAGADAFAQSPTQLANPASQNCMVRGGALQIERRPDGGQFGVCVFADNRQCEEWALFHGECPADGLRVTGYLTPASRYCAITGGRYAEPGTCTLPGGKTCDAEAFWAGTCSR
jgi:putative hemolysin